MTRFLQWWNVDLVDSALVFAACCLTVLICNSSGSSRPFSPSSFSRFVKICSFAQFCSRAWFVDFFRCGGSLAYMICSMMAWADIPKMSLASFCISLRESTTFWFAGLKVNFWNFYFAAVIDWGLSYFLRKTAIISPRLSRVGPLLFFKVFTAIPFMREWKQLILSSSASWLWILGRVWKRSPKSSIFSFSASDVDIVVVTDFGN